MVRKAAGAGDNTQFGFLVSSLVVWLLNWFYDGVVALFIFIIAGHNLREGSRRIEREELFKSRNVHENIKCRTLQSVCQTSNMFGIVKCSSS